MYLLTLDCEAGEDLYCLHYCCEMFSVIVQCSSTAFLLFSAIEKNLGEILRIVDVV